VKPSRAALALAALLTAAPARAEPPAGYAVSIADRLELDEGQGGAASLTIAPQPGYSISTSGPLRVALAADPADGLELPRRRYRRSHAADRVAAAPRFDLAVRGARAGSYRLAVDVRFWLCRGRSCRPVQTSRAVAVTVRPPAPAQR
jgi:hypothetical protein